MSLDIISSFCSYMTYISYTFCRQPIYSLYHYFNYSYLMLTNFISSDFFSKKKLISSSIWVVLWVLYAHFCAHTCVLIDVYCQFLCYIVFYSLLMYKLVANNNHLQTLALVYSSSRWKLMAKLVHFNICYKIWCLGRSSIGPKSTSTPRGGALSDRRRLSADSHRSGSSDAVKNQWGKKHSSSSDGGRSKRQSPSSDAISIATYDKNTPSKRNLSVLMWIFIIFYLCEDGYRAI